ncbi:MAG TPA: hydrogenase [Myxococcales bacterium]|nr:hydrogenase [Myxococcales bacterium]
MTAAAEMLPVHNGRAAELKRLPDLPLGELARAVESAPSRERRVAALFGAPEERGVRLYALIAEDEESGLELGSALVEGNSFPSMTPRCPEVHLFEREIAEQWDLRPEGHPWLKPVRFHRPYREGADVWERKASGAPPQVGVTDFYRVEGEEVHEVAVGPVHAGVIEPGHFRFQCHGEQVFHLEISLGYQHRGVERSLVGGPGKRTIHFMETLAGDTTVGHATAYCQVLEGLAGCRPPARAQALRAVALELERLANHVGDLGALAGDVAFLPTAAYCGRLRGDFLNLTALLCGSRFGRGMVRPGGVGFDVDAARVAEMKQRLEAAAKDVGGAVGLLWTTASVQARFEETGSVAQSVAKELGLVGVAARACGLRRDARKNHPSGIYQFAHIPMTLWHSGDVFARAYVRWMEIQRSVAFITEQLGQLPAGAVSAKCGEPKPSRICASLVEGWRGEICHVGITGEDGRFRAYKVVDPSFHNWSGLAMALRDQQISDFPLCNKSFNLSYCGHDL